MGLLNSRNTTSTLLLVLMVLLLLGCCVARRLGVNILGFLKSTTPANVSSFCYKAAYLDGLEKILGTADFLIILRYRKG